MIKNIPYLKNVLKNWRKDFKLSMENMRKSLKKWKKNIMILFKAWTLEDSMNLQSQGRIPKENLILSW